MATKYKQYFENMLDSEKELFDEFRKLHDRYSEKQDELQEEFNKLGEKVMKTIHEWEDKLCSQSEKAGYGYATSSLSEKFMSEVRKEFPMIDFVGVISVKKPTFSVKKISLG